MPLKAIFFDAVGTLFHLSEGPGVQYAECARRLGCEIAASALQQAFLSVFREMPVRPATRKPRPDDDRGWWRELVGRVLDRCGIDPPTLDRAAYFDAVYARFSERGVWELYPEVREVLDALRPHYALGIISNFDGRLRKIIEHLEIAGDFRHIVLSSEAGADKPDPWIFECALAAAHAAPAEVLHAGDDPIHDWKGAEAAGIRCFRLERPRNSLRDVLKMTK